MGIECSGYRDVSNQKFLDESDNVVEKARKSYKANQTAKRQLMKYNKAAASDPPSSSMAIYKLNQLPSPNSKATFFSVAQPLEEVALGYFMSACIPGSRFDYLLWMYGDINSGLALSTTVRAASMAALASGRKEQGLMNQAYQLYAKALSETNLALADPTTATDNSTLVSVMLLSYFEAIYWTSPTRPANWKTHADGALTLIKLRGIKQLETSVGRSLFVQVTNLICVDKLLHSERLPKWLVEMIETGLLYECQCPRFRVSYLMSTVSWLLADIKEEKLTPREIVQAAQAVDAKYIALGESLPPMYQFQEVILEKPRPDVYGKIIHEYMDHRVAYFWNSYRMARVRLNGIMFATSFKLPPDEMKELQAKAKQYINEMAADVCASIPQFSGALYSSATALTISPCSPTCDLVSYVQTIPSRTAVMSLLWPLNIMLRVPIIKPDIKTFALGRLQHLARLFSTSRADDVALDNQQVQALSDKLHMFYIS